MKPTQKQIDEEIAALAALTPVGRWKDKTADAINLQIETLKGSIDSTCLEWDEFSDEEQILMRDTEDWKLGRSERRPSQEWGGLVA